MSISTSPPLAAVDSAADPDDLVQVAPDDAADRAEQTLTALVEAVGGELRGPQVAMARSVASSLADGKHLAVQAPTGTGKSFAYLIPAAHHAKDVGGTVIVATATKTLQAQLVESDLETIKTQFPSLRFALLKGRGNFVCHLEAKKSMDDQGALFSERINEDVWDDLRVWMEDTETGDRDEAPDGVTDAMWSKVSVGSDGCVGSKCSFYAECFSERARDAARAADVVVTNHHMLLIEKVGGAFNVLPYHDAVIVDEGHKLLDTASNIAGITMKPSRFKWLGDFAKSLLGDDAKDIPDGLYEKESRLEFTFEGLVDSGRINPAEGNVAVALNAAQSAASKAISAAKRLKFSTSSDDKEAEARRDQFVQACDGTVRDISRLLEARDEDVVWVSGGDRRAPTLRSAPLDLADTLHSQLFADGPVVLTSATLTTGGKFDHLLDELGLSKQRKKVNTLSVASPFDYAKQSVLYVPMHLPQPKGGFQSSGYQKWEKGALDTTLGLVKATEGRALLLFTSWKRLNDTADFLELKVPYRVMRQGDAPPARLIERLREDENSILCATASFWEGVSIDGDAVSLVVVDKLPFGRRDDPLLGAMRDLADQNGGNGFRDVDLPRTSRMLAQGVGRLIRTVDDFGVCAVLDNRVAQTEALARKKGGRPGYGDMLLADLPPMRKTATLHADDGVMPEDLTKASDTDLAELLGLFEARPAGPPAADWARVRLEMSRRARG